MKIVRCFLCAGLLASLFCADTTFAREGDYILRDGKAYRVQQGTSVLLEDCEPQTANTDKGLWSWILVDPGQTEAMKGSEGGIYFFLGEGKTMAGFLPIKEEASSCRLYFSPSGEKLLVNWGMEYIQHLSLYFIDSKKGLSKKPRLRWLDLLSGLITTVLCSMPSTPAREHASKTDSICGGVLLCSMTPWRMKKLSSRRPLRTRTIPSPTTTKQAMSLSSGKVQSRT